MCVNMFFIYFAFFFTFWQKLKVKGVLNMNNFNYRNKNKHVTSKVFYTFQHFDLNFLAILQFKALWTEF